MGELYQNPEQYFDRLLALVKKELDLYIRYAVRLTEDGKIRHIFQTKIFREELSNILEDDFAHMNKHAYDLERRMLFDEWCVFHETAYRSVQNGVMLPFEYMMRRLGMTEFEKHCACLAIAPELNREYERMYCYLQDDYKLKYPTLDLCIKMYSMDPLIQNRLIHQVFRRKELLHCIFREPQGNMESDLSWTLKFRTALIDYVFFYESDLTEEKALYELSIPEKKREQSLNVNLQAELRIQELLKGESEAGRTVLLLTGPAGSGKRMQVKLAAASMGRAVLLLDIRKLTIMNTEKRTEGIRNAVVRAFLDRAYLCLCYWEAFGNREERLAGFEEEVLRTAGIFFPVLFLTAEKDIHPAEEYPGSGRVEKLTMELPAIGQRIRLWREFLEGRKTCGKIPVETLAAQFDFTPGMMKEAVNAAAARAEQESGKEMKTSQLCEACQQRISHRLGERASRVNAAYTWEELILEEESRDLLRQACSQISFRYQVYEEWGFQSKLAYGRGVSMMFTGPPGTGKTMAAQVIANELNLGLYKVDLSGVLSKYIGETQKNLKEIFDEVHKSRSILFFDEADVLFGKRVGVTDARDISANAQTAYLLQKMEEYDGITILATNLMQNFDDAYKRRIKYIIPFAFPRAEQRRELWKHVFPREMPLGEDLDTEYLASNFELSGAAIKNIALNAAFLAASEGVMTGMKHIMTALQQEYQKFGKTLGKDELKEYYMYKKQDGAAGRYE